MRMRALILVAGAILGLPGLHGCHADAAQSRSLRQLPFGYRAQVPDSWSVQEQGGDYLFVPPDQPRDAQGNLLEMIVLGWRAADGVDRPDDPRVIQFFVDLMSDVKLVGTPESRPSGLGPGLLLTFEGSFNGDPVRRLIYLTLHDRDALFVLYAHNPGSQLTGPRLPAVEQIFATLSWAPPANDAALAGGWRRETTTGSTGATGNWFATDVRVFIMAADGSAEYGSASTLSASASGGYAFGQGDPNVLRGHYHAADGKLRFKWQGGGRDVYDYAIIQHEGVPHLKLQVSGGRPVYHRRIQ